MSNENLQSYNMINNYFTSRGYEEVDGINFYKDIYPNNEEEGATQFNNYQSNAIYIYESDTERKEDGNLKMKRRLMLKDTWEEDFEKYIRNRKKCFCSGLSYLGKANKLESASKCHAIIIDLDKVTSENHLYNLLYMIDRGREYKGLNRRIPKPTYIVSSGTGLHIYFVFDEPIELYPNIKIQLKSIKHDLTRIIWWGGYTTKIEDSIQYQGISQGFRMVGSLNEKHGNIVKAFKIGDKISLDYFNDFIDNEDLRIKRNEVPKGKITRAEAKKLYPEWYERVVLGRNHIMKKWNIGYRKKSGVQDYALFEWWFNRADESLGGHRYFYLMCLVIYACKNNYPYEKLEERIWEAYEKVKEKEHDNDLTEYDVRCALEVYDRNFYNYRIEDIAKLSNIPIKRNKRNGRKQENHIKVMNMMRKLKYEMGELEKISGRPPKMDEIEICLLNHQGETNKSKIARESNLSRPTLYKYLGKEPSKEEQIQAYRKEHPTASQYQATKELGFSKNTIKKYWNIAEEGE